MSVVNYIIVNLGVTLRKNFGSGVSFPLFFIWRKKSPNKKRASLHSLTQKKNITNTLFYLSKKYIFG